MKCFLVPSVFVIIGFLNLSLRVSTTIMPTLSLMPINITPLMFKEQPKDQNHKLNDTLIFAHIILGNGETKVPDEHLNPDLYSQLTNEGKQQLFEVGQYIRRRYDKILGKIYSPGEIYTISMDSDSAILSALSCLAGLFEQTKDENLLWQLTSMHTLPKELDTMLYHGKICEKYISQREYVLKKSAEAMDTFKKYSDDITHWSEESGRNVTSIESVTDLRNELMAKKCQNKQLEKWEEDAIKPHGTMETISNITYKLAAAPKLARLWSGFLIKDILERSAQKLNSTLNPDRSVYIYSANSLTLISLLNALGLDELTLPPCGSSLYFELYKASKNQHYLQFIYRKPGDEDPIPVNIQGCGEKWTLEQFYSAKEELIPGGFDEECKV